MIKYYILLPLLFSAFASCAQESATRPHCTDDEFDQKVAKVISFSVPVIGVEDLKDMYNQPLLLDAREKSEYDVSHIEGAQYIGYKKLDLSVLDTVTKDQTIVVYCSIGYRSEKIGEKLINMGYTNVFNLYGSIFEWVNRGNEVVDENDEATKEVHTYNKKWSKWVNEDKAVKVW